MTYTIKNHYDYKINFAKNNEGKVIRIWEGTYVLYKNGLQIGIEQSDESGDFKNWRIVECLSNLDGDIIKVRTLKEAKHIALNYKLDTKN